MDTTAVELKSYQEVVIDTETGEEIVANKWLYLSGHPREYRFNGQNGQFNLYGDKILLDDKGKILNAFSFQPINFRVFEDCLFGRTEKEMWAELFFVDKDGCVSSIMFNNTSVSELFRLMEPLHYEKMSLLDVILTARPERVTSKNDPSKSWWIARFSYEIASPELSKMFKEYVNDHAVYRRETITPGADHKFLSRNFTKLFESLLFEEVNGFALPTATEAEIAQ